MQVACPTCKKMIAWDQENKFRPFCCERCKLIDLGAWADGSYAIPDQPLDPQDLDEYLDKEQRDEDLQDEEQ